MLDERRDRTVLDTFELHVCNRGVAPTNIHVISVSFRLKLAARFDDTMPSIVRTVFVNFIVRHDCEADAKQMLKNLW